MAPDEANVHYLLGKLYKVLHDKANAIKHFTAALNLDPKVRPNTECLLAVEFLADSHSLQAAQYIKDAMESLDEDEMEDEDIA
jgi:anaphase-promoting complex subunit 3